MFSADSRSACTRIRWFALVLSLVSGVARAAAGAGEAVAPEDGHDAHAPEDINQLSLEELNRRLDNPLTNLWSLVFQGNYGNRSGDAVNGERSTTTAFFQPALPIPVGDEYENVFIARPVIPWVKTPVIEADGSTSGDESGLGDIQLAAFYGPNRVDGVVWGAGATFKFPTATDDLLGEDKWQAGPALLLFKFTKTWTVGILAQHWNSFAGNDDREDTSQTDIQYVIRRQLGNGWSLGMGPTIVIDWKADSDNRYTVPVGLGLTKTFRIGKMPFKARIEPQYSIVRPDNFGEEWNIRVQIAPIIQSPFRPTR